jgi:hypothetical protein
MYGLNLSSFANWFPTQFSMLHDIVAKIPKKTIVVWSVTANNFEDSGPNSIQRIYPVSFVDAAQLLWWNRGKVVGGIVR